MSLVGELSSACVWKAETSPQTYVYSMKSTAINTILGGVMKISEVVGTDSEKVAADNLKQTAKRMNQQASAAQAKLKVKKAQQQLVKAVQPIKPQ